MLSAADFKSEKIGDLEPFEMLLVVVEVATEKYTKNPFSDYFKNWGRKGKRLHYGHNNGGSERKRKSNWNYLGIRELAFQNHDLLNNPLPDSFKNCLENRISGEETDPMVKKRRKIEQSIQKIAGPNPPPEIPEGFKKAIADMKGTHIELVIQKRVFKTDVSKNHGRFSIPVKQVRFDFLSDKENRLVWLSNGTLEVMLIQPSLDLKPIVLNFRKWVMPKKPKNNSGSENNTKASSSYVLITNWNEVVKLNQLREGEIVQLWAFRWKDSRLSFAMVRALVLEAEDTIAFPYPNLLKN
ncbi:B3 domain-containing protein At2g31720-like [Dillenia turbinata]|uniref:B3 domain-containing protein At2g31720-like n=1 Tax=Dillenia turbinata TaxID=194707 RepID=A0AAN8UNT4_9MAGN